MRETLQPSRHIPVSSVMLIAKRGYMKSTHSLSVIAAALVFSVSLARGQDRPVSVQEPEGAIKQLSKSPLPFISIDPCRIVDTRGNGFTGAYGPPALTQGSPRTFTLTGQCGISPAAEAVSLNVTVTNAQGPGFILIYPKDGAQPSVSTLNYVAGQTVANAAIVPLGTGGGIVVIAGVSGTHLILDVNGYSSATSSAVDSNVFLGPDAGNAMVTGGFNTGIGGFALRANVTGSFNTAVGRGALGSFFGPGDRNVAVGYAALSNNGAGSNNIAIGATAGLSLSSGSDNIYIGNTGASSESGQIRIGTFGSQNGAVIQGIYGGAIAGLGVVINSGGRLGTTPSSRRFKENIRDIDAESEGLMSLRPVAFQYKRQIDPSGLAQYGLIAEEVAEIYPEMVVYDAHGRPETIRYQLLDPLLLNEVQKQHRIAEAQRFEIEELKGRLSSLELQLTVRSSP